MVVLFFRFMYSKNMKKYLGLQPGYWSLHILPPNSSEILSFGAATFAEYSPLIVLDCGRQYGVSAIAHAVHRQEEVADPTDIQRGFSCSETARLLQEIPAGKTPILILDLLSTFFDDSSNTNTRKSHFVSVLFHLRRLSRGAGLAVMVPSPPASFDANFLFSRLADAASRIVVHKTLPHDTHQMKIF